MKGSVLQYMQLLVHNQVGPGEILRISHEGGRLTKLVFIQNTHATRIEVRNTDTFLSVVHVYDYITLRCSNN